MLESNPKSVVYHCDTLTKSFGMSGLPFSFLIKPLSLDREDMDFWICWYNPHPLLSWKPDSSLPIRIFFANKKTFGVSHEVRMEIE